MPSIYTLVPDIQALLKKKEWVTAELAEGLGHDVASRIQQQFKVSPPATLRLSGMGPRCPKALWHSIHTPGEAESLPAWAETKFSLGHIVEAYAITMAKAAGHLVEGEQDELVLDGIKGHRDCVIDGCVVDVKSTSSRQFTKYRTGDVEKDDAFGYLDQLDGYVSASQHDPLVTVKDKGYILAIDKQLGHMVLYEHTIRPARIHDTIGRYKGIVAREHPPACTCGTKNYGSSGNVALDTRASYSAFKWSCFPELRCFIYSDGPVYLTKVVRRPDVREVNKYGETVYVS